MQHPLQRPWRWHRARVVAGHGVASGRAADSPYPAGTIALQRPLFAARGIDLSPYFEGTLNLCFSDSRWQLHQPDAQVEQLRWTACHPPETFSFWRVALRWDGCQVPIGGLLYRPHPETKQNHHHGPDRLEVLAPWIEGAAALSRLELGVDPARCRRIQPLRLQARLLEALKFRVLASQADFYRSCGLDPERLEHTPSTALLPLRSWLATVEPEALDLHDHELLLVLQNAWRLYGDDRG